MSTIEGGLLKNEIGNAASRAPVEIWQEIIDHLLWDPVIFSCNPFYPGCNFHCALDEWHDTNRAYSHEVQCGSLRLVSRSWKCLVDASGWRYFEPYRCADKDQRLTRCRSARRIRLQPIHPCEECSIDWDYPCLECRTSMDGIYSSIFSSSLPQSNRQVPMIVEFPCRNGSDYLPHNLSLCSLRALAVCAHVDGMADFLRTASNLTFLGIKIPQSRGLWGPDADPPLLPVLKTLQLHVDNIEHDNAFLEKWDLPELIHLDIHSLQMRDGRSHLFAFFEKSGARLLSLRLHIHQGWGFLPPSLYENMPRLQYLGTTAIKYYFPSPPPNHPLHTIAILEEEMGDFRSAMARFTKPWNCITRIADCHQWNAMPKELYEQELTESFEHEHEGSPCWMCVGALYTMCSRCGRRYEDRTGKTLAEFLRGNGG